MIGKTIGSYEIEAKLGEGGMGVVYRARDTRLERTVALKVLPEAFADDRDRQARFEREAQAVAALSHPNILAIHDTGIHDGQMFVVTELLEGETLRERLEQGPLSARKTIGVATQIAQGLAAAHDKNLVHRDLKPDNVFLLADGQVKILDFGLARSTDTSSSDEGETKAALTDPGTALGTVGYMAPEQVRGQTVDARSDLFSFGAVIYEMLAGQRAFQRDTNAETMTAILREEPPELIREVPNVPQGLARLVQRCLEKNPEQRFQSARDLAFHLSGLSPDSGSDVGRGVAAPEAAIVAPRGSVAPIALLLAGIAAGLGGGWLMFRETPPEAVRVDVLTFSGTARNPATSPDGQTIAYSSAQTGVRQIWLKQINGGGEAPRTSGPDDYAPRFSPDGTQILFIRQQEGQTDLFRVPVVGGEPRRVLSDVFAADWSPDGTEIAFITGTDDDRSTIGMVRADGTERRNLERLDDWDFFSVTWSPDARWLASYMIPTTGSAATGIRLTPLTGEPGHFLEAAASSEVVSGVSWSRTSREVVYAAQQPGSASSRIVAHDVVDEHTRTLFWTLGVPSVVDVSASGTLVYDAVSTTQSLREIRLSSPASTRWLTRGSSVDRQPASSPDNDWVIFSSNRSGNRDLWTVSRQDGTVRQLTDDAAADWDPAFTADGTGILWSSDRGGHYEIWMASADGSGARQVSQDGVDAENPTMTLDGEWVVYASGHPDKRGIWKMQPDGSGSTRITAGSQTLPEVSPDGRYVAYLDDNEAAGRPLAVRRLDTGDVVFSTFIDRNGTDNVNFGRLRWMPDGRQLAFAARDADGRDGIFVQDFAPGADTRSTRRRLAGFFVDIGSESFGLTPDGSVVISTLGTTSDVLVASGVSGLAAPDGGR